MNADSIYSGHTENKVPGATVVRWNNTFVLRFCVCIFLAVKQVSRLFSATRSLGQCIVQPCVNAQEAQGQGSAIGLCVLSYA